MAEACRRGEAFEQICSFAQRQGGLVVHPYMGIESVWRLADDVHGATGVPVQVLGPPPPATWIANDKVAFDAVVALTLGVDWLVESIDCVGSKATVEALETLATRHQVVGLKRLRSASAMGNRVVRQRHLETLGAEALVRDFLAETGGVVTTRFKWLLGWSPSCPHRPNCGSRRWVRSTPSRWSLRATFIGRRKRSSWESASPFRCPGGGADEGGESPGG